MIPIIYSIPILFQTLVNQDQYWMKDGMVIAFSSLAYIRIAMPRSSVYEITKILIQNMINFYWFTHE